MNGYGRGEASNGDISVTVEIRAQNNRTRDVQIRLPKVYLSLEPRIKKSISEKIVRGRIEVFIHRNPLRSGKRVTCDTELAEQYYQAMMLVAKRLQREPSEISLTEIYKQPGVLLLTETKPDALQEWFILATALEAAIHDVCLQRHEEGEKLQLRFDQHIKELQRLRNILFQQQENINHQLFSRLEKRLKRLLGDNLDPRRLEQEAAILVEKSDCSEELYRLEGHCISLGKFSDNDKPVGRQLDLILQELNREINTIGSKVQEHAFSQIVISLKYQLEKMREIVSHIE